MKEYLDIFLSSKYRIHFFSTTTGFAIIVGLIHPHLEMSVFILYSIIVILLFPIMVKILKLMKNKTSLYIKEKFNEYPRI